MIVGRVVPGAIDSLDEFCVPNAFVLVCMSSSGAQEPTSTTNPLKLKNNRMVICNTGMLCLQASLTNAILILLDENYASNMLLEGPLPPRILFAGAARWVNAHAKRVILNPARLGSAVQGANCECFVAKKSGILLLSVFTRNFDHFVCVDGARRMILDWVEQFPLLLGVESLKCCVGCAYDFKRVLEMERVDELLHSEKRLLQASLSEVEEVKAEQEVGQKFVMTE